MRETKTVTPERAAGSLLIKAQRELTVQADERAKHMVAEVLASLAAPLADLIRQERERAYRLGGSSVHYNRSHDPETRERCIRDHHRLAVDGVPLPAPSLSSPTDTGEEGSGAKGRADAK